MISDTEGRIWGTGESVQAVESVVGIDFFPEVILNSGKQLFRGQRLSFDD